MILTYENEGIRHPDAARRAFFFIRDVGLIYVRGAGGLMHGQKKILSKSRLEN